ncbi:hypothetical protein [uncultured Oscillibacter sp.]|uniref:hypothetical protein n=1 Tax=uncultured Oscillibacter sp. TaxID=876091 RepID=UPI002601B1EB|nr:hypothetical protein [uncultured Oscillibacter sp.]
MSDGPKKPTCYMCPHDFRYTDAIPMRRQGVMMRMDERYCLGGKRARLFKKRDPSIYTPSWCPKRKIPCELRIYTFKSSDDWWLHISLEHSIGQFLPPDGHRHALASEAVTGLSPREFWRRLDQEAYYDFLEITLKPHDVVEIDDGLNPAFFCYADGGFRMLYGFDAAAARRCVLERR